MQRWLARLVVGLTVASVWGVSRVHAQGAVPQTYSFTEDPAFALFGPSVVKVSRDGFKEVVDQFAPPGPGRPKEFHNHIVYDFQAHKVYSKIVSDPSQPCGVHDYNNPIAPPELDVISGASAIIKELTEGNAPLKQVGTETLNGIPTKVMEVTGKAKVWIAQEGGFPVRVVTLEPDGKATTIIEVKQLSFAKPPASAFTPPTGCAPAPTAPVAKPTTHVTALTLQKIGNYTGPCPAHLTMVGTITTDGPGTVFFQFGAGKFDPGETLTFRAAGTQTVTHVMTFQPKYGNQMGGSAILEATGVDSAGKHAIPTQSSNNSDFNITCTSGGGK